MARVLGVTPLTVSNREKAGRYPQPHRDLNNYRIYSLNDVLNLQLLTHGAIDARPVMAALFDQGHRDAKTVCRLYDAAVARRRAW